DELTATGFRLSGIRGYVISDANSDEIYNELKDKKAILILTQTAARLLGEKAEKLKLGSIVLIIPEKHGEDYLSLKKIIRDTIGFDLKT
ncbi:MAG: hypothetical protein FJY77_06255, partial [Candidatus Altiarchaeales archaeon]|nr:hypothetical protein [Candidatus Altiarchaeales archaeon]